METYRTFLKNNYKIGILIIISALSALVAVENIKISTDSMRYALISQQILSGNGIRIPLIEFDNIIPVDGTVPFLVQPSLMPILLAMLGGVAPQSFLAAQILNVICHVAIAIFTFLLMRNFCNKYIALLTGILVSTSFPMLYVTNHFISEPLFITLTVVAIYFLITSRDIKYQHNHRLILAGICASAAILTRYAGIALLVVFFWEAFILIKNKKLKSNYGHILLAITIPLTTIVLLFARNYMILGTIEGINLPKPERSYLDALTGTIEMLFMQFQLGKNSIILIILFMMLFIISIFINTTIRRELLKFFHSGLDLIIIFIISYTILISYTLANQQPYFELRYVIPLVPFLFIISIFIIVFVWERIKFKRFSKLSLGGMILSLGIIAFGNSYKTHLNLPEFFYKNEKVYSILQSCTYKWIKENYGNDIIIATNEPYRLSFFGGYSTIIFPNKKWIPNYPIPENMEHLLPKRMSEVGAQVLALFDGLKEQHYGSYLARLFNERKDYDKFTIAYECPDGVVYHLKK